MIINQLALKRQITVLVLMILIALAGISSYQSLPRESAPDITVPYVIVTTTQEGVAPKDMETLVTIPLERKIKSISDIEELTSVSDDGLSQIIIEFTPAVDIDDALQKVRDKVDQAKSDLPDDLDNDPVISEINLSEAPVLNVVLSGPYNLRRLKQFAEEFEDKLEGVEGVLDAEIVGGLEREIHVEFDLDRVRGFQLPFSSLIQAVERGNVNMPGGSMDIGQAKYLVRVPEEFDNPTEINQIVAFVRDGKPVYLRDLAQIKDSHRDPKTMSRLDGVQSVTVQVVKRSGENLVRIVEESRTIVEAMRPQFPPDLNIDLTNDQAEDVRLMVKDLENNIFTGLVLVLAVVLFFIGGRSAIFVAAAIPFSMLITFTVLEALGVTLNMVVLFSLTLALGMLVDNGIVIVENIYRHMQEGKERVTAAREAVDEVAWPVITSTLTTVGAFFPLLFWPGIMGEFMGYLPLTVIIALFGSLFTALVINPVLSARYQTVKGAKFSATATVEDISRESRPKRIYYHLLHWSLRHRIIVIGVAFAMLVASIVGFGKYGRGVEFFPDVDPNYAMVHIEAPVGTNLETSDALVRQAEAALGKYDNIKHIITRVGSASKGEHISEITMEFKPIEERSESSKTTMNRVREELVGLIKGAEARVEQAEEGPPQDPPVNMEITGESIQMLGELVYAVRKRIADVPGMVDLEDDFVEGKPEIKVRVDKEKAALLGLDTYTIAYTVKTAINGVNVGVYREGKEEYDIVAKLRPEDRRSVEDLERITISGPNGEPIPLTSLARVEVTSGYGAINRLDQKRVATISAEVSGRMAADVLADIEARLADFTWPRGYTYSFTGEQEEQEKAQNFLSKAFVVAVFVIFLVLVTQFNSAVTPFIVIASVLLSLIGVFVGLLITNQAFGVIMTGVGVISLAGVVVNNAIVLIDYYQQLNERGLSVRDALIQAGLTRFRPVLLTAITTILGLLPMATGVSFDFHQFTIVVGGESSQWWSSMAVAVIFGLTVSTLLTLLVVPSLCSMTASMGQWRDRRKALKTSRKAAKTARTRDKVEASGREDEQARGDEDLEQKTQEVLSSRDDG